MKCEDVELLCVVMVDVVCKHGALGCCDDRPFSVVRSTSLPWTRCGTRSISSVLSVADSLVMKISTRRMGKPIVGVLLCLCWSVVVCVSLYRYVAVFVGLCQCVSVYGGVCQCVVVCVGLWWCVSVCIGVCWFLSLSGRQTLRS